MHTHKHIYIYIYINFLKPDTDVLDLGTWSQTGGKNVTFANNVFYRSPKYPGEVLFAGNSSGTKLSKHIHTYIHIHNTHHI